MLTILIILLTFIIFYNEGNFSEANPLAGMIDPATEGEFPFIVSISYLPYIKPSDPYGHACGGALITRKHVLTSAHCFESNDTANLFSVLVGSIDLQYSLSYAIKTWIKYDDWVKQASGRKCHPFTDNDIAIVELTENVSQNIPIPRISMSSPTSLVGRNAVTAGWGVFFVKEDIPKVLRKAYVQVISRRECLDNIHKREAYYKLEHNFMCSKAAVLFVIFCEGDSGGPLLVKTADGQYEIVGVNEGGAPVHTDWHNIPDEQMKYVSVHYYLKFIKNVANLSYL